MIEKISDNSLFLEKISPNFPKNGKNTVKMSM